MQQTTDTPDLSRINPYQWTNVTATLSLDVAAPYVSRMHLDLPVDFRAGLRAIIEDFRSRETESGIDAKFIPEVLAWAQRQYGQTFAEKLFQWGQHVFAPTESASAIFLWSSVVQHTGYPGREPLPPAPQFVVRLREILGQAPRLSIYEQPPVTPWDRTVYERQHYDEFSSPMNLVQATMDHWDFVLAWAEVRKALPGLEQMAAVKAWGTEVASRMGLPMDRLGEPGNWPDLPASLPG